MKRFEALEAEELQVHQENPNSENDTVAVVVGPKLIFLVLGAIAGIVALCIFLFGNNQPEAVKVSAQPSATQMAKGNSTITSSYTVEIDGKTYNANTKEEVDQIIQQDIQSLFSSGEPSLPQNALQIESGSLENKGHYYEYSFVVKNNTNYNFTSLDLFCALLDEDDNILGSSTAHLSTTLPQGKKAKIKQPIYDLDPETKKIALDYAYYDTNGDHHVSAFYFSREVIEQSCIIVEEN